MSACTSILRVAQSAWRWQGEYVALRNKGWGAYWSSGYMGEVSEDSCDIIITIAELKDITGSMTVGNEMLLEWAGAG